MSTYEIVIDELITHLKGELNRPAFDAMGVNVKKTVQYTGDYERLAGGEKPRISIGFLQSRYGTDENGTAMFIGNSITDRAIYLQCSIACKQLWGEKGAVNISQLCERMALGFQPSTGGEIYVFATTLQTFDNDVWYFRVILKMDLPLQPLQNFIVTGSEPLGGNLVEATFTPEILQTDGEV